MRTRKEKKVYCKDHKKLKRTLKITSGPVKESHVTKRCNNMYCRGVARYICTVLILISVCPASGAVVKRGFSLMNLIMNDLRSSMNVLTLDATMRIHYQDESLTHGEVDGIIDVWKRCGNRRTEL